MSINIFFSDSPKSWHKLCNNKLQIYFPFKRCSIVRVHPRRLLANVEQRIEWLLCGSIGDQWYQSGCDEFSIVSNCFAGWPSGASLSIDSRHIRLCSTAQSRVNSLSSHIHTFLMNKTSSLQKCRHCWSFIWRSFAHIDCASFERGAAPKFVIDPYNLSDCWCIRFD